MSQEIEHEMSNRYYFNDEKEIYLDLGHVDFMWKLPGRVDRVFELKLLVEDHPRYVEESIGKEIFQALKAYRSPPPKDPRVANAPWLSERQKSSISSVMAAFGPSPLKPGVIAAPEARINQIRESCGVPFMRPIDSDSNSSSEEDQDDLEAQHFPASTCVIVDIADLPY